MADKAEALICEFCHKRHDEVKRLVIFKNWDNPKGVPVCNECVSLLVEVLAIDDREWLTAHVATVRELEERLRTPLAST